MRRATCSTHARRGFSLIELVMLVGCVAILLTTSGVFLHQLMQLDRSGRDRQRDLMNMTALARAFRNDVRAARSARVVEADGERPARLELERADGVLVAYGREAAMLLRLESKGGKTTRREGYRLVGFDSPRFASDHGWVSLDLPRKVTPGGAAIRPGYYLEARLDKDHQTEAPK